jgi:hypothetical protein
MSLRIPDAHREVWLLHAPNFKGQLGGEREDEDPTLCSTSRESRSKV